MKQSVQLSDSVHVMVYLAVNQDNPDELKSGRIAESIQTNPSNVRKIMGNLRKAGLIISQQGKVAPKIARSLSDISLLDIFKSLPGDNQLLQVDAKTNIDCPIGANIQDTLQAKYLEIQELAEAEMAKTSLSDLVSDLSRNITINNQDVAKDFEHFIIEKRA